MAIHSPEYNYLFVLNPRTGCTATSLALHRNNGGHADWLPREDVKDERGNVIVERKHTTLRQLLESGQLTPQRRSEVLVFTAVRNTFDSLVSLFVKMQTTYVPLLDDPESFIHRRRMVEDIRFAANHDFSDWVEHKYGSVPRGETRRLQGAFLHDADRVLRFEHLQEDLDAVLDELDAPRVTVPLHNVTEGREPDYRQYYSPGARATIERVFDKELSEHSFSF